MKIVRRPYCHRRSPWGYAAIPMVLWFFVTVSAAPPLVPELIETRRIGDRAPHNAFTDLVRWRDKFYCAFREGQRHAGDIGNLRILVSEDGDLWQSAGLLSLADYDLRDAALSVTPHGRLMVLGGAQQNQDGQRRTGTFVSFSDDGRTFSAPQIVLQPGRWLWRVTWHGDVGYGVAYGDTEGAADGKSDAGSDADADLGGGSDAQTGRRWTSLYRTTDGIHYEAVTTRLLGAGGWPTEARLRFTDDGTCFCLHRRDGEQGNTAYLGTAVPPYTDWSWRDLQVRLGGPNFVRLPGGAWVAAGRLYDGGARTELLQLDVDQGVVTPILRLPSGGDTSYPGMVWHDHLLWVSYYASHEGGTNVYLSRIRFPGLPGAPPVDIGNRRELFVDRHVTARMRGVTLRLHHPRPAESVLQFDRPWEGAFCGYTTVFKDRERFRMYYRGLPRAGRDGTELEVTCYAESHDGVHWKKPSLGRYEIHGTRDNNVVLHGETPASHNFCPFVDSNPAAAKDQQYKALGGTAAGLIAFVSPDGWKWRRLRPEPVFAKGVFDSQNVAFYSESEGQYVCYFRTWTGENYSGYRSVSRTTSTDFIHWTDPVTMTFGSTPLEHLYTNQTTPYYRAPHIYLGVAARFMPGRQVLTAADAKSIDVDPDYFGDCSDAVLLSSRGGGRYARTFMQSFIRPGPGLQNWVSRTNYPALGIVPTGDDEVSIYVQKNYGQPTAHVQRYTLRVDGFASVHADYDVGEMVTKPLVFSVSEDLKSSPTGATPLALHLNFATSAAGSVRVELQDAQGTPVPGYMLPECDAMVGDRIDRIVTWQGQSDLARWAGQPVRLRFEMKDADLYSLQIR